MGSYGYCWSSAFRLQKEGLTVATEKDITVALDTTIDTALEEEGFAREVVSKIQNMRREMDLEVADRIEIKYSIPKKYVSALANFEDYIKTETLALKLSEITEITKEGICEINGNDCRILIEKK